MQKDKPKSLLSPMELMLKAVEKTAQESGDQELWKKQHWSQEIKNS